jgi:hypothetical protein
MPLFSTAFTPPAELEGLTVSAESPAAVRLEWSPSTLSAIDFVSYNVYRSMTGAPDSYELLAAIGDQSVTVYDDYAAPIGARLFYRVTQSSLDDESLPAEATSWLDICEWWLVIPGVEGASFELPNVTTYDTGWPLQRVEHEPLGRSRKLIETGEQLGEEGSLRMLLTRDDAAVVPQLLAAIAGTRTLVLKTPYSDVLTVQLGPVERSRSPDDRQTVTLRFVQTG